MVVHVSDTDVMTAAQTQSMTPIYTGVSCEQQICSCPYHLHNYPWNNRGYMRSRFAIPLEKVKDHSVKVIPSASDYTMMTLEKRRGTIPPTWNGNKSSDFSLSARSLPILLESREPTFESRFHTKELYKDIPENLKVHGTSSSSERASPSFTGRETASCPRPVSASRRDSDSEIAGAGTSPCSDSDKRRVKDDEGFIRRAACVCVNEDESQVLLISSKTDGKGWLIPGGGLEDGEAEENAAVREAWEEAGVKGLISRWLGVFQSEDETTHKKKRTSVFVLKVSDQANVYPESELGRTRKWFLLDAALETLAISKPNQKLYLQSLHRTK